MKFGSLFAGIGGFDLGLERAGMTPTWQVEIDDYCNKVLEKHWPDVRRYRDVKEVHGNVAHTEHAGRTETEKQGEHIKDKQEIQIGKKLRLNELEGASGVREYGGGDVRDVSEGQCPTCLPAVDLICGGFPCQPYSVAGKRKGADDDRNLWPDYLRIVRELRPTWVVGENVPGIVPMYLDQVLSDLEGEAYTCWTFNIPALSLIHI